MATTRSGQVTVTTAGTAVQGTDMSGFLFSLVAHPDNTDTVWVGNASEDVASTTGYPLQPEGAPVVNIGQSTATLASNLGARYLALHKELDSVVEVSLRGTVRDKYGQRLPVSRIRAGQRIKLTDWQGGKIYWIYKTRYDVATDTLTLSTEPLVDPVRAAIQNLRQQAA